MYEHFFRSLFLINSQSNPKFCSWFAIVERVVMMKTRISSIKRGICNLIKKKFFLTKKWLLVNTFVPSEHQDEVVYYDTFESADDIMEDDTAEKEELRRLQASARQLEARRGRINAKRSYLWNKRVCARYTLSFSSHYAYFEPLVHT